MAKILSFIGIFLLMVSCIKTGEDVYIHNIDGGWHKKNVQHFEFEIKDAQQPKNIIFVVRNNNDYPYSNLRVFSALRKDGEKNTKPDTLNFVLAQPNGEWLGSGFGDTKEILFQYKPGYRFPANGKYRIEVTQAMRKDVLPGIEDFGIKIENAKP